MAKVPLMESMSTGDKSTSEIERKGEIELSGSAASESGTRIWLGGFCDWVMRYRNCREYRSAVGVTKRLKRNYRVFSDKV